MSRKLLPVRGSNPVIKMLVIRYLTAEKQICVDQETHLWITYCSAFVTAYAFIPTGSPRYIHQSRKEAHYSYVWKWSGRALPWCSGLSAGAMQTQTMMSPAAAWPGQNCNSHQKATVGFPKTKHSKHIVLSLLWGLMLMKDGLIVGYVDEFFLNTSSQKCSDTERGQELCIRFTLESMH